MQSIDNMISSNLLLFLELSIRSDSESFSRGGVTVNLEWTLLNSQNNYQQFLCNVSVSVNPQPKNVMFTGNMRVQLELSYNTPHTVNVTQHSTCRQLNRTKILELNFSEQHKMYNNGTAFQSLFLQASVVIQWI